MPSTSILTKAGSPWVATRRSSVVAGTSSRPLHSTQAKPGTRRVSATKSADPVVTVGVRGLTRSTTLPGRAATAWRSTVTPRSGQHSTRRTSARSGWGSSATTRAPSRAQQSVRLPTWAPTSKQRSPGRTKRA